MADKLRYEENSTRLTEKEHLPTEEFVQLYMGGKAWERLMQLEAMLRARYDLTRELRFPFGNSYGWGFRYTHKNTLLLYVFFEKDSFCCTISINDKGAPAVEAMLEELCPEIREAWENRYACGAEGGWVNYSVSSDAVLPDLIRLVEVKVKAKRVES